MQCTNGFMKFVESNFLLTQALYIFKNVPGGVRVSLSGRVFT